MSHCGRWAQGSTGRPLRFFVTGTDTNVGKTQVSAALLRAMVHRGLEPFAFKPFESGMASLEAPSDSTALRQAAGSRQPLDTISLFRFTAPLAPGIAARLENKKTSWKQMLRVFRSFGRRPGVVEGAGGLFVPLDERHDVIDAIEALKLPAIVVARAGLGTINHTVLTVRELLAREVRVHAVVLVRTAPGPDVSIRDNRAELERRFPRLTFVGPVPYRRAPAQRAQAFDAAIAQLLA